MKKLLFLLLVGLIFCTGTATYASGNKEKALTITIKSSPDADFQTSMQIRLNEMAELILQSNSKDMYGTLPLSDMYITVQTADGKRKYILNQHGTLFHLKDRQRLLLPEKLENELLKYALLLRKQHYGDLEPWDKMKEVLPRNSKFEVIDLETGQHFRVQRRAGDLHADVQPLSTEDTKTMKDIYEGKWSWKRRSILVKAEGRLIAASMHGMPHGAGAIQNGFPGHFCIHFYKSSTHRSENVDPTHELMVFKAAGHLGDYFEQASPYELIDAFLVAVNQQDTHLLRMTLAPAKVVRLRNIIDKIEQIEAIRVASPYEKVKTDDRLAAEIPVDVSLYVRGKGDMKAEIPFIIRRNSPYERWRIDIDSLKEFCEELE